MPGLDDDLQRQRMRGWLEPSTTVQTKNGERETRERIAAEIKENAKKKKGRKKAQPANGARDE